MIVRCDQGGLGNQTWDICRHVKPDEVLIMKLEEKGRGKEFPERYNPDRSWVGTTWSVRGDVLDDRTMREFAMACDKILTVETIYHPQGYDVAREHGATTVLIANPELYAGYPADVLRVPTRWALDRMPRDARVLPHPVARDVLPFRKRTECRTFYHPAAPAMLDRNGTQILLNALPYVQEKCSVIIRSHKPSPYGDVDQVGNVQLRWIHGHTDNYWESYPEEADVLIMPRRYGGLCLPVQEAASLGMPALMTNLEPQSEWPFVHVIPVDGFSPASMKGGTFNVYESNPELLALIMDHMIRDDGLIQFLSTRADEWAEEHSWDKLLPQWKGLLA